MKRNLSEDKNIFSTLPLEILNRIQLNIVSFLYLSQTCKYLYQVQKSREEEIYMRCVNRIKHDLQKMDLLGLVQICLPLFKGVIQGDRLDCYLKEMSPRCIITIYIPFCLEITRHYNYIQNNINHEKYKVSCYYKEIHVRNKDDDELILKISSVYALDLYKYFKKSPCTDLNTIYYSNIWKFLYKRTKNKLI